MINAECRIALIGVESPKCVGCGCRYATDDPITIRKFNPRPDLELRYALCTACSLVPDGWNEIRRRVFHHYECDLIANRVMTLERFMQEEPAYG